MGESVDFETVFYPKPYHGKKEGKNEEIVEMKPVAVKLEQQMVAFNTGKGKRVANSVCHCIDCWFCLLICTLMVIGGIVLSIFVHLGFIAVPIVMYLFRISVLCCTDTRRFLYRMDLDINPYEYTYTMMKKDPHIVWDIQCYHYITKTRTVTDSEGHSRTETYQERVNTHHGRWDFKCSGSQDASPILRGL